MKAITQKQIPLPSHVDSGYPPGLEEVVMCALSRSREERYSSARDLELDLKGFAGEAGLDLSAASSLVCSETSSALTSSSGGPRATRASPSNSTS